ncbi:MAG: alpha/beta hydrolase-fold protein [Microscillaceae bacterium]|nr:alpha/beta hydrolase-fold protein [Microscillaceae bacterium]MDW8461639.1 alpha/beta hydrolase-fold protein [Cytophagales bacterium]
MEKKLILSLVLFTWVVLTIAQIPQVSKGKIERIDSFPSQFVTPRNIDVWLPEGYSAKKKYAVLYMHDGQMLFDANTTWNKQEWGVDETMSQLLESGKIKNTIVVGIWNTGKLRRSEYFPQKAFDLLTENQKDTILNPPSGKLFFEANIQSDNYLKFLVQELKPYIDKKYATLKNKNNTFIAGSSMGGLISLYALCEYPDVFGGAACLSTHWIGGFTDKNNPIPQAIMQYLEKKLPNPKNNKIYFDTGTATIDAFYPPYQKQVDEIMRKKGFQSNVNWITQVFEGEPHNENAWKKRLHIPLTFLLKK